MENKDSLLKFTMKIGAFLGLALIIYALLLYAFGMDANEFPNMLYLLMILAIFLGTKRYRDTVMNGFISYPQALKTGTLIALFSAFIYTFYTYVFFKFIDPSQLESMINQVEMNFETSGYTEEQTKVMMQLTGKFMNGFLFFTGIFSHTFLGFIFSLIISIFLKKENTSLDTHQN